MELIDVPHFGWKPENSVLGLSAFVDFEITGFAFFRTEFRVDRVLPICYGTKYTLLPHSNNPHIYSQPGGSYIYKVLLKLRRDSSRTGHGAPCIHVPLRIVG